MPAGKGAVVVMNAGADPGGDGGSRLGRRGPGPAVPPGGQPWWSCGSSRPAPAKPKAKVPLDELESIRFERTPAMTARFMGQPNVDFTMPGLSAKKEEPPKKEERRQERLSLPRRTKRPRASRR